MGKLTPILAQVRMDAVRDHVSQLAQLQSDELEAEYNRGRYDGRVEGYISEGRWWRFGVLCGIALSVLIWRFWP